MINMFKNLILKHLVEEYEPERADQFALWAFGEDYKEFTLPIEFLNEWNRRHGHEYWALLSNKIYDDIVKMISLWRSKHEPVISQD